MFQILFGNVLKLLEIRCIPQLIYEHDQGQFVSFFNQFLVRVLLQGYYQILKTWDVLIQYIAEKNAVLKIPYRCPVICPVIKYDRQDGRIAEAFCLCDPWVQFFLIFRIFVQEHYYIPKNPECHIVMH